MKIATYNVWNENKGRGDRFDQLVQEIRSVQADVIGLQEVTPHFYESRLREGAGYLYSYFEKYGEEEEGLAFLSKYPLSSTNHLYVESADSHGLEVFVETGGCRFLLTNVHLPWNSALRQERLIVNMDLYIHKRMEEEQVDFCLLLGDFNGSLNSSVHRYLLGEQTLEGYEANPYWFELSSTYAALQGEPLRPTLDFRSNPRWEGKNTREIPIPADRIYCMDSRYEIDLRKTGLFGTEISPLNGLCASDHYGLWAELDFKK